MNHYVKDDAPQLKDCVSMEVWLLKEVEAGRGKSPEVQQALQFFGREKFAAIWKAHQEAKKS